jgi:3-oxoacyl-[acyl-carrier protein] reductase
MGDFAGKAALVSGGSRGVGRAMALEFARRGANIGLLYRSSRELAKAVAAEIEGLGVKVLDLQADLNDAGAAAAAVSSMVDAFGSLDILAHSAGAQVDWKAVRDHDPLAWGAFVQNDLVGAFNIIQPAVRRMHEQRSGVVVAISSIAAQMCQARNSQGAAAKSGLEALIRVVAREEGRHGIRANAISIGLTDTDQARQALDQWGEEATQKIIAAIPLGRMGRPEEIAGMAAYLASDAGSYITGKVLQVDGGQIISG